MLEEICSKSGVEVEETWVGNDGETYAISRTGRIFKCDKRGFDRESGFDEWGEILTGKLKPVWVPKLNEQYYTPDIFCTVGTYYETFTWENESIDTEWHRRGLVFKTKEEAKECALNMIELANHGI